MTANGERVRKLSDLLHEAAETHHIVYRIVDGDDPDWATWYSDWLVNRSKLVELLQKSIVRSELTYALVKLDKDYVSSKHDQKWEDYYAEHLLGEYGGS